jgi:hypothetical protein
MDQIPSPRAITAFVQMRLAAFRQNPGQVFKRKAGDRLLAGPYSVKEEAAADWEFALLSVAAYGRSKPKRHPLPAGVRLIKTLRNMWKHKELVPPEVPNVDGQLNEAGWRRWEDFPDPKLEQEMKCSHLRAEVWEHKGKSAIVVAFGGTIFTSGRDWGSNLRWFTPWRKDEYTEIVSRFGPDFVTSFALRRQDPENAFLANAIIYSTGHSLGGGLAQQFAYSMPPASGVPRVSEVYAFDPSPVTGYRSVNPVIRDINKVGLKIGRIYERGEVLAILRSLTSLFVKPSTVNPEIRGARFSLFYSLDPVAGHSIAELAKKMRKAAQRNVGQIANDDGGAMKIIN